MSETPATAAAPSVAAQDLCDLLARASLGDVDAFMRFYDATSGYAFALGVARARVTGRDRATVLEAASDATVRRFTRAWEDAAEHRSSGLSPLAWLLSLPISAAGPNGGFDRLNQRFVDEFVRSDLP